MVPEATVSDIEAGQETTGFSLSVTMIVKLHSLKFPAVSVARYVICVLPTGNKDPDIKLKLLSTLVIVGDSPELSVAVGMENVTTAPHFPESTFLEIFPGQGVKTGFSESLLSEIVTVKLQVWVFPEASVAVNSISVVEPA